MPAPARRLRDRPASSSIQRPVACCGVRRAPTGADRHALRADGVARRRLATDRQHPRADRRTHDHAGIRVAVIVYSDGLVERRSEPIGDGLERLQREAAALVGRRAGSTDLARDLAERMRQHSPLATSSRSPVLRHCELTLHRRCRPRHRSADGVPCRDRRTAGHRRVPMGGYAPCRSTGCSRLPRVADSRGRRCWRRRRG